ERATLTVVEDLALAYRNDLAADRLLGSRVGNHDSAGRSPRLFEPLHHQPIVQRTNLHRSRPPSRTRNLLKNEGNCSISTHVLRVLTTIWMRQRLSRGEPHKNGADLRDYRALGGRGFPACV